MQNVFSRAKYVVNGEDGASNLEIVVWMAVVMVIAGFLFAFRNQVSNFINAVTTRLGQQQQVMENQVDTGNQLPAIANVVEAS